MKILHVNISDIHGGASRAVYRLHKALLKEEINSEMLVQNKVSDDYTVIGPSNRKEKILSKIYAILDRIPTRFYKNKSKTLFSPSWVPNNIVKKINKINPDIVHLHWINGGMIPIKDIAKINNPIVWSLHDMWPFTGGEHYDEGQKHYVDKCGKSIVLGSNKENDLSRYCWEIKQKTYLQIKNLTIIGLSKWIHNCAKESSLLKNKKNIYLPNLIDTTKFKPINKETSRELWGLPKNKKLILFGAVKATSDMRKGFKELSEAVQQLNKRDKIEFVIFGSSKPLVDSVLGFKTHYLGHLHDDVSLVSLYSAVDVMVVPSLQEAFGQTASEAMSCGTPTVAFGHTGLLDIIDHKENGYLAQPFDTTDLKDGIEWVLDNVNYQNLCENARDKVIEKFDSRFVVKKYIELYKKILQEK